MLTQIQAQCAMALLGVYCSHNKVPGVPDHLRPEPFLRGFLCGRVSAPPWPFENPQAAGQLLDPVGEMICDLEELGVLVDTGYVSFELPCYALDEERAIELITQYNAERTRAEDREEMRTYTGRVVQTRPVLINAPLALARCQRCDAMRGQRMPVIPDLDYAAMERALCGAPDLDAAEDPEPDTEA